MRKSVFILIALVVFFGCKEDDDSTNPNDEDQIVITTEDFIISIDENPELNQEIGTVIGAASSGTVLFAIESQIPEGAVLINADSGLLTVGDPTAFDFETNQVISGTVRVSAEDVSETLTVLINVNDLQEIIVTTADFEVTIFENPEANQLLGVIEGDTNEGEVTYTLVEQNPAGAFVIESVSGELRVDDPSLFDYELNPILTGVVAVENEGVIENANITVNLLDISACVESNQAFQQELFDLDANDDGIELQYTLDLTTHEYTFSPNSDLNLCSIGYQGYDETPYLMEIVDSNDNIIFSEFIAFSNTEQDEVDLTALLPLMANESYTIRRIQNDYENLSEIIGFIFLSTTFSELDFPYVFDDITILSSDFYGTGGPIPNVGIPFISLGFE